MNRSETDQPVHVMSEDECGHPETVDVARCSNRTDFASSRLRLLFLCLINAVNLNRA